MSSADDLAETLDNMPLEELCLVRIHVESLIAYRLAQRPMLFSYECRYCQDSGRVGDVFCICPQGQAARHRAAQYACKLDDLPLFGGRKE